MESYDVLSSTLPDWSLKTGDRSIPTPTPFEESFRHSGWTALRALTLTAIRAAGGSFARAERFAKCGALAAVWLNESDGRVEVRSNCCHDRFCRPCAAARGQELQRQIKSTIPAGVKLRFVTLTLRHQSVPLADVLERLRTCFSKLRNRKWWKDRVEGGVQVLEVKLSKSGAWHPHLHMILEGSYLSQQELSREWLAVTGDSFVVDVRAVADRDGDCRELCTYVTKYITKPCGLDVMGDNERFIEYVTAMKGTRILNMLGTWRERVQDDDVVEGTETAWVMIGTLREFIDRAIAGDTAAKSIIAMICTRGTGVSPPPLTVAAVD